MPGGKAGGEERDGQHIQRVLLLLWSCFIVYGSFVPFRFAAGLDFVRANLANVQMFPFEAGTKNFSLPDIASNVLLFCPFGLLLARSGFSFVGRAWPRRFFVIGVLALGLATTIELGQLFAVGRRSSGIDVEFDVVGAFVGGAGAFLLQRYERQVDACWEVARAEPRLVPIVLLVLWLCAGAFYPFAATLDVSTAWHNLRHAKWVPFRGPQGFWLDRVMDVAVAFALLGALTRPVLRRYMSGLAAGAAAVAAIGVLGVALEAGKLLFVGRLPNMENVLLAFAGAVGGVVAAPPLMAWSPVRRRPELVPGALALLLLVYSELTPFAFALSSSAVAAQVGRIEWIPLHSYSRADAQSALFDLWRKLLLSGFWGFSFAWITRSGPGSAAWAGLVVGGVLEAAQLLTIGRIPGIGDTLILGLGAWMGGVAYARNKDGGQRRGGGRVLSSHS